MTEPLLTTAQVADRLSMSTDFVREHAGELGGIRAGGSRAPLRFPPEAIRAWIERQRLGAIATAPPAEPPRRRPSATSLPRPTDAMLAHFR